MKVTIEKNKNKSEEQYNQTTTEYNKIVKDSDVFFFVIVLVLCFFVLILEVIIFIFDIRFNKVFSSIFDFPRINTIYLSLKELIQNEAFYNTTSIPVVFFQLALLAYQSLKKTIKADGFKKIIKDDFLHPYSSYLFISSTILALLNWLFLVLFSITKQYLGIIISFLLSWILLLIIHCIKKMFFYKKKGDSNE